MTIIVSSSPSLSSLRHRKIENTEGIIEEGKTKAKKNRDMVLTGLGIPSPQRTLNGWPAVSSAVLQILAGNPSSTCDVPL